MTRLRRSKEMRRPSWGIGSSKMNTPVIVERSAGSFSTDHMSASVSLIRSWYSISSIAGAYDARRAAPVRRGGCCARRHSLGGLQV